MKPHKSPFKNGTRLSISIALWCAFICTTTSAQTQPTVYCLVTFQKVQTENEREYEKVMAENWKPLHQLQKQNGKIINWTLYKIHFKGSADPYNYVSVTYYNSFLKTEPNDDYLTLMKAANPKADAPGVLTKTQTLRTIVGQSLYSRVDGTTIKTPAPIKYILVSFQKSKPGMHDAALKAETEDWKAVHQAMVDAGQMLTWNVWDLVIPAGSDINHNYFTSNIFSSYEQAQMEGYIDAFKKTGKEIEPALDRIAKTKDMVRRELLEFVTGLN